MNAPKPKGEAEVFTHDAVAERRVLGACIIDPECWIAAKEVLRADDFFAAKHEQIWRALELCSESEGGRDTNTLRSQLVLLGKLDAIGGDEYLLALTDVIPNVQSAEELARRIRDLNVLRQLKTVAMRISAEASEPIEHIGDFLERAVTVVNRVVESRSSDVEIKHIGEICEAEYSELTRRQLDDDHFAGLQTGFKELDRTMVGLGLGDVTIVAGRPGMGKSAFAAAVRMGVIRHSAVGVLSFEIEMDGQKIAHRTFATETGVDLRMLKRAEFDSKQAVSLAALVERSRHWPHHIVEEATLSLSQVRRTTRRHVRKNPGCKLICIDYLQLMRGPRSESREQEISAITRDLKALAKELHVHVMVLSQLNRELEKRPNKRPHVADLRESGAIEQDADNILLIYRDEVYDPDTADKGVAEIIIGKQRQGPIGTVRLHWTKALTRFDNLEEQSPQEDLAYG